MNPPSLSLLPLFSFLSHNVPCCTSTVLSFSLLLTYQRAQRGERGVNEGGEETSLSSFPLCIASLLASPSPAALAHPTPSSLLSHSVLFHRQTISRDSFPNALPLPALSECPPSLTPRTWRLCWLPYPDCARGAGALLLDRGATACAATCVGPAAPSCRTTSRGCHALRWAGSPLRFSRSRTCGPRRRRRCARQRRGCLSQAPFGGWGRWGAVAGGLVAARDLCAAEFVG